MVEIVSRDEWGARPWDGTVYRVPITERTEFFVHYHGGPPPTGYGVEVPRVVEDIHLGNGWAGTGYNFMVDLDGVVYEGRGWDLVGAHCPGHNRSGIGVYVAIGGDQEPTQAALRSVRALYDELEARTGREIAKKGHRDGKATECPGDRLYAWVLAGMPTDETAAAPVRPIDKPTGARPLLREGSRGRHVEALVDRLIALGFGAALDPNSDVFGPKTEAAVKAFQKAAGITVDGIVGPQTYEALDRGVKAPRQRVPAFPGTVRRGDRGPAVAAVQARLRDRGWRIAVDEVFGPQTERVVRAFQAEKGLRVDGIAGPKTWEALWLEPVT